MPNKNTEILTEILRDLDFIIESQTKMQQDFNNQQSASGNTTMNLKIENNENVVALLAGIGALGATDAEKIKTVGEQLAGLVKGLNAFSKLNQDIINNINAAVTALAGINSLQGLEPKNAQNIVGFANELANINLKKSDITKISQIADLIQLFNGNTDPASFIDQMEALGKLKTIEVQDMVDFFNKLASVNLKKTDINKVTTLMEIMNVVSGKSADPTAFIKTLKTLNKIKDSDIQNLVSFVDRLSSLQLNKKHYKNTGQLFDILKLIGNAGQIKIKDFLKTIKSLSKFKAKHARKLGLFVYKLLSALPGDKKHLDIMVKQADVLIKVMKVLNNLKDVGLKQLVMIGKIVNPKHGEKIGNFIVGLIDPLTKIPEKQLNSAHQCIKAIKELLITMVAAIAVMMILVAIDWKLTLIAIGIVVGTLYLMTAVIKNLAKEEKDIKTGGKTVHDLAKALLLVVGAIVIMSVLINMVDLPIVLLSVGIVVGILFIFVSIIKKLSKIQEEAKDASQSILMLTICLLLVTVAITILSSIPFKKLIMGALGAAVIIGIMYALVHMTKMLAKIDNKDMEQAILAISVLTVCLLAVSLIAAFILPSIGEKMGDVLLGTAVVLGIVLIMILFVKLLGSIKHKDLDQATSALLILTACLLVVSLMALFIFPVIAEKWEDTVIGAGIVLGIVGLMTLMVIGIGKVGDKDLKWGVIALGVMTICLLVVSFIALTILPEIGANWELTAIGGAVVMSIVGLLTLLVWGLSKIDKKNLLMGIIALALMVGAFAIVSNIALNILPPIGENWEVTSIGAAVVLLIITALAGITAAVGYFAESQAANMAIGGVALLALSGLLGLMGLAMDPFIELCGKVVEIGEGHVLLATAVMIAILGAVGIIAAALGALFLGPQGVIIAALIALGGAVIAGLSFVMMGISSVVDDFVKVADLTDKIGEGRIEAVTAIIKDKLIPSITDITTALSEVGVWTALKASLIAVSIRPIFETIAMFMEVINNLYSLKVVEEWDEKGKPKKYKTVTPAMFDGAAKVISKNFTTFIKQLGYSMKSWNVESALVLSLMAGSISPIMKGVGDYVNAICKFISYDIPTDYDKEGKPIKFRKVGLDEFRLASENIAKSFLVFMETLQPLFESLSPRAVMAIHCLKAGIEPLMRAVGTYTNTILEFVKGYEQEIDDPKNPGKRIKKHIDFNPLDFEEAGKKIANCFVNFITTLADALKEYDYDVEHTFKADEKKNSFTQVLDALAGIEKIMNVAVSLAKFCLEQGEAISKVDLPGIATTLSKSLVSLVDSLTPKFGNEDEQEKIELLTKAMGKVEKLVKKYKDIFTTIRKNADENNIDKITSITMYSDLLKNLISEETIKAFDSASSVLDTKLQPTLEKLGTILSFFDTGKISNINLDFDNMKKNVETINKTISTFTELLIKYQGATEKTTTFTVFETLTSSIKTSYITASTVQRQYTKDFGKISATLRSDILLTLPSMSLLLTAGNNLTRMFSSLDRVLVNQNKARVKAVKDIKNSVDEVTNAVTRLTSELSKLPSQIQSIADAKADIENANSQSNSGSTSSSSSTSTSSTSSSTTIKAPTQSSAPKNPGDAAFASLSKENQALVTALSAKIAQALASVIGSNAGENKITVHLNDATKEAAGVMITGTVKK